MLRSFSRWLIAILCLSSLACPLALAADPPSVPILLFHRLGPVSPDEMTVTTPVFETQLKMIKDGGYKVIPLQALVAALGDSNAPLPEKAVVLCRRWPSHGLFRHVPLIKRQVPFFCSYPRRSQCRPRHDLGPAGREMKASSMVISRDTYWHPNFNIDRKRLTPPAYEKFANDQLTKSKAVLEQKLGGKIDLLAWPFGIHDDQLEKWAEAAGYTAAFTIQRQRVTRGDKMMALPRFIVLDADRGGRFENLLKEPK